MSKYAWPVSWSLVPSLAVLVIAALVYWPGLSGGFVFDDFPNIVHNDQLRASTFSAQALLDAALSSDSGPLARPLTMLSFSLQVAALGLAPFPLKLANLGIHLVNGALIFLLAHKVLRLADSCSPFRVRPGSDAIFPVAVAAVWLLAPVNLTGVLYVVQRMESLSTLFMLFGLLAYLHGRMRLAAGCRSGLAWMVGGVVGGSVLAALAKETGLVLPAYALVLEWVLFGFRSPGARRLDGRVVALFGVTLLVPGVLGVMATLPAVLSGAAYAGRPFTLAERLLTEARVMVDYIHWIVLPNMQALGLYHDDYPVSRGWLAPAATLLSMLALASLLALALWLKERRPLVTLGILFFLVGHSLVSTYLPLELVYEHRNYLPSLGVFLALFAVLMLEPRLGAWRSAGVALAVGLVGLAGFVTLLRASEWSDPVRLAYVEASRHPSSPRANYELGRTLVDRTDAPNGPALSTAMQSFHAAAALPGSGLIPLQALIMMEARRSRPVDPALWQRVEEAVTAGPLASQDVSALYALIACRSHGLCNFDAEPLGQVLALAVQRNPGVGSLQTLLANYAANITHDYALALRSMHRAVALEPGNPQYWGNLISLQIAVGNIDEARAGLTFLRELNRFGNLDLMIAGLNAALQRNPASGGNVAPGHAG